MVLKELISICFVNRAFALTKEVKFERPASLSFYVGLKYDPNQLVTDSIVCVNSEMI